MVDCSIEPARIGLRADRYQELEQIGAGGTSVVYRAHDSFLDKKVAIKYLRSGRNAQRLRRFQREARLLSSLRSDSLPVILDFGLDQTGAPYMVMEFIDGLSLREYVKGAPLADFSRFAEILIQICNALEAVHAKGISHQDLTPANIIIREREDGLHAILVDFGLASITNESVSVSTDHGLVGTPAYMSPEQIRGQRGDHRSDIYSLGCVMFELLTGSAPYIEDNTAALLSNHLTGPMPTIFDFALTNFSELPPLSHLQAVLSRCLAKDAADRYDSVDELTADLRVLWIRAQAVSDSPSPLPAESQLAAENKLGITIASFLASMNLSGARAAIARLSSRLLIIGLTVGLFALGLAVSIIAFIPGLAQNTLSCTYNQLTKKQANRDIRDLKMFNFAVDDFVDRSPREKHEILASLVIDHDASRSTFRSFVSKPWQRVGTRFFLSPYATDADLKKIKKVGAIRNISLVGSLVNGTGLSELSNSGVEFLDARTITLSEDGFRAIGSLSSLKDLRLDYVPDLNEAKLYNLTNLHELKKLSLRGTSLDAASLACVVKCEKLRAINLNESDGLSDSALVQLAGMKKLRVIFLSRCSWVTKAGIDNFRKLRPDVRLLTK